MVLEQGHNIRTGKMKLPKNLIIFLTHHETSLNIFEERLVIKMH